MKILIYKWNVFNQEDICDAFEYFGHSVDMYKPEFDFKKLPGEDSIDFKYDDRICELRNVFAEYEIIFSVNYFSEISDLCNEMHKIYVCWTVDSPMISMYHQSVFNECNYMFLFDKFQYVQFKNIGVKHVYYLPLAVNTTRVQMQLGSIDNSLFSNEIAFVGGMYHKNSYDDIKYKLSPYLQGYFEGAMNAQMNIYGDNILDNLLSIDILTQLSEIIDFQKDVRAFSDLKLVFISTYLGYKLAWKERVTFLNALAGKHRVGLYTDEKDKDLSGVQYRGSVNYLRDMPKVFNNSRINLNLTIRNIRTGIPLRVWDVLGAGGFLLTNYQVELDSFFENGKDIVYFDSIEDCLRKADYYLAHEDERMNIAANGLSKVKENHSYIKRIEKILEVIKNRAV